MKGGVNSQIVVSNNSTISNSYSGISGGSFYLESTITNSLTIESYSLIKASLS